MRKDIDTPENTMKAETWLDIIPSIPLAWGVPVRQGGYKWVAMERRSDKRTWLLTCSTGTTYATADQCSIDLDDPQGFGYALRQLWQQAYAMGMKTGHVMGLLVDPIPVMRKAGSRVKMDHALPWREFTCRVRTNQTTAADRLALARAHAELVSP